jgi:hypothetical protein
MRGRSGIRLRQHPAFQAFQAPTDLPIVIAPQLNQRVLIFSLVAAAVSAVLFGLVPARQSLDTQVVPALKSSEQEPIGRHRTIGRNVLVVAQVALSMVLLVATCVLLDGFRKSLIVDPGFRTDHLVMMSLDTSFVRYTPVETRSFYRNLVSRTQALPGVASAALTSAIPLDRGGTIERVMHLHDRRQRRLPPCGDRQRGMCDELLARSGSDRKAAASHRQPESVARGRGAGENGEVSDHRRSADAISLPALCATRADRDVVARRDDES